MFPPILSSCCFGSASSKNSDLRAVSLDRKRRPLNDTTATGVSPCLGTGARSLSWTRCNSPCNFFAASFRFDNMSQDVDADTQVLVFTKMQSGFREAESMVWIVIDSVTFHDRTWTAA